RLVLWLLDKPRKDLTFYYPDDDAEATHRVATEQILSKVKFPLPLVYPACADCAPQEESRYKRELSETWKKLVALHGELQGKGLLLCGFRIHPSENIPCLLDASKSSGNPVQCLNCGRLLCYYH